MAETPIFNASLAFNWLDALQKKTIKNISHIDFLSKYRDVRIGIDKCVLILQGLRFTTREVFLIRIHGAMYEPFAGPHYVQIGDAAPFWVHSLTAFRREFFGITDKLSFERSVFVGLSDGEVVRLKVARPYLFMPNGISIADGTLIKIMKTPATFFHVGPRAMAKHCEEIRAKKVAAAMDRAAVRKRVRKHLVASVEQLFCSYMRDTHIDHQSALSWFHTDMQYALSTCQTLYSHMSRVRPEYDEHDMFAASDAGKMQRPGIVAAATLSSDVMPQLAGRMSRVDPSINEALRAARERLARDGDVWSGILPTLPLAPSGPVAPVAMSGQGAAAAGSVANLTEMEEAAHAHMLAFNFMQPLGAAPDVDAVSENLRSAYEEDLQGMEEGGEDGEDGEDAAEFDA